MTEYMKANTMRLTVVAQALSAATLYLLTIAAVMHQVAQAVGNV